MQIADCKFEEPSIVGPYGQIPAGQMTLAELPAEKASLSGWSRLWLAGADAAMSGAGGGIGGPANPYRQSVWFYACIRAKATNAARVPLRLSVAEALGTRGAWGSRAVRTGRPAGRKYLSKAMELHRAAEGEIVASGDLYTFLARPNARQTWGQFIEATATLLDICGRVHWVFDDMIGRRPVTMYCIPGRRSKAVTRSGRLEEELIGWEISGPKGGRVPVALDECITIQQFDPDDPNGGLSPRDPARLAIVADYNASLHNAAMFANNCEPGTVLGTDAPFDADKDSAMRSTWLQRHRGAANANSLAILWGGLKYVDHGHTLSDMVYPLGKQLNREEVCAVLRVPPSVAGFVASKGDASAYVDAEQERFWQDTMVPLLEAMATPINNEIAPRFDTRLEAWWDVEQVPLFQKLRRSQTDTAAKYFGMGVPLADLNDYLDLGLPDRPWHGQGFLPAGLLPAADVAAGDVFPALPEGQPPQAPAGEQPVAEEDAGTRGRGDAERKKDAGTRGRGDAEKAIAERIWKAWAASWNGLAKRTAQPLRLRVVQLERRVLAALKRELPPGKDDAETRRRGEDATGSRPSAKCQVPSSAKDDGIVGRILVDVFQDPKDKERFRARMRMFVRDANALGLRQALAEAGLKGDALDTAVRELLSNPRIIAAIADQTIRVTTIADLRTREHVRRELTEGLAAGEDYRKLATRVQSSMSVSRARAMTIARNTVGQALSQSRHTGQRAAGMTVKVWLHSRGAGERRPAHVAAEAAYAGGHPIDQPYIINGAALMYPRDPAGPAAEIINCQCLSLARRAAEGKAPGFASYDGYQFVSYDDLPGAATRGRGDAATEPQAESENRHA